MKCKADVVCLSHLRWGFVFQRPNHLISRCARSRRTFFWEEPIFDAGVAPDGGHLQIREVSPGLRVAVPHLPQGLDDRAAELAQRRLLDGMMAEHGVRSPVLWFYTPMALGFAGHVEAATVVYDCMDELSAFRGAPPALRSREADLFARADVVFTGGHSLYEAKRAQHPRVYPFPSSVDREHFARARDERRFVREPEDQAPIGRPRVGYFGVIDERIDLHLVARVADAEPSWQIVMVGPVVKIDPKSLPRRPNIHYLGQKSYGDLPAYIAGWDVAMMPFALNESTRFISPTKTLEYLAAGKPVVSTAVRDVVRPYGELGIARIGEGATFVEAIAASLSRPAAQRAAADGYVARTSWDRTWRAMWEIVERTGRERAAAPASSVEKIVQDEAGTCSTI